MSLLYINIHEKIVRPMEIRLATLINAEAIKTSHFLDLVIKQINDENELEISNTVDEKSRMYNVLNMFNISEILSSEILNKLDAISYEKAEYKKQDFDTLTLMVDYYSKQLRSVIGLHTQSLKSFKLKRAGKDVIIIPIMDLENEYKNMQNKKAQGINKSFNGSV